MKHERPADYHTRLRAVRVAATKDPDDPRHGSPGFYTNHGCRCPQCKEAHKLKVRAGYERRKAAPKDPNDPRHGKHTFYTGHGCRCEKCVESARGKQKKKHAA